jgi:hypothetical protein
MPSLYSDTNRHQVIEQELQRLRIKVGEIYALKKLQPPKITLVIVQKRNHLRAVDDQSFDRNPPPGTYVDDVTVIDEGADNFYMYSHLVRTLTLNHSL